MLHGQKNSDGYIDIGGIPDCTIFIINEQLLCYEGHKIIYKIQTLKSYTVRSAFSKLDIDDSFGAKFVVFKK